MIFLLHHFLLYLFLLFSLNRLFLLALLLLLRILSLYLILQIQVKVHFWFILASLQQLLLHLLQSFFLLFVNQLKLLFGPILQVLLEVFILFDFSLLYVLLDCLAVVLPLILKNSLLGWLISLLVFYLCREIDRF